MKISNVSSFALAVVVGSSGLVSGLPVQANPSNVDEKKKVDGGQSIPSLSQDPKLFIRSETERLIGQSTPKTYIGGKKDELLPRDYRKQAPETSIGRKFEELRIPDYKGILSATDGKSFLETFDEAHFTLRSVFGQIDESRLKSRVRQAKMGKYLNDVRAERISEPLLSGRKTNPASVRRIDEAFKKEVAATVRSIDNAYTEAVERFAVRFSESSAKTTKPSSLSEVFQKVTAKSILGDGQIENLVQSSIVLQRLALLCLSSGANHPNCQNFAGLIDSIAGMIKEEQIAGFIEKPASDLFLNQPQSKKASKKRILKTIEDVLNEAKVASLVDRLDAVLRFDPIGLNTKKAVPDELNPESKKYDVLGFPSNSALRNALQIAVDIRKEALLKAELKELEMGQLRAGEGTINREMKIRGLLRQEHFQAAIDQAIANRSDIVLASVLLSDAGKHSQSEISKAYESLAESILQQMEKGSYLDRLSARRTYMERFESIKIDPKLNLELRGKYKR